MKEQFLHPLDNNLIFSVLFSFKLLRRGTVKSGFKLKHKLPYLCESGRNRYSFSTLIFLCYSTLRYLTVLLFDMIVLFWFYSMRNFM